MCVHMFVCVCVVFVYVCAYVHLCVCLCVFVCVLTICICGYAVFSVSVCMHLLIGGQNGRLYISTSPMCLREPVEVATTRPGSPGMT